MRDVMNEMWACSNCSSKFPFKELECVDGANQFALACPNCKGGVHLHKLEDVEKSIPEFHGDKGILQ